jgi:hypothetical protein
VFFTPAVPRAPMARLRQVAIARGALSVRSWEASSAKVVSRTWCRALIFAVSVGSRHGGASAQFIARTLHGRHEMPVPGLLPSRPAERPSVRASERPSVRGAKPKHDRCRHRDPLSCGFRQRKHRSRHRYSALPSPIRAEQG